MFRYPLFRLDRYRRSQCRVQDATAPDDCTKWGDEPACKPGSVPGRLAALPFGDHPSRRTVAGTLQRSTRRLGRAALERLRTTAARGQRQLLDLAPGGVYRAIPVTRDAGGLLHHRFTLTGTPEGDRRSVLCGTVPRLAPGCRCQPPCPVAPGLS